MFGTKQLTDIGCNKCLQFQHNKKQKYGDTQMMDILKKHGADIYTKNNDGLNTLDLSLSYLQKNFYKKHIKQWHRYF